MSGNTRPHQRQAMTSDCHVIHADAGCYNQAKKPSCFIKKNRQLVFFKGNIELQQASTRACQRASFIWAWASLYFSWACDSLYVRFTYTNYQATIVHLHLQATSEDGLPTSTMDGPWPTPSHLRVTILARLVS
jgi:hypothetical protein